MPDSKPESRLLFLSFENFEQARFAEILFNSEAKKIDLLWQATALGISLNGTGANISSLSPAWIRELEALGINAGQFDLNFDTRISAPANGVTVESAELIVVLSQQKQQSSFKEMFPLRTGGIEFWEIESEQQTLPTIKNELKNLYVRLILKGGKRKGGEPKGGVQTEQGNCFQCHKPLNQCSCRTGNVAPGPQKKNTVVRIMLEKKGRRGKLVTTVTGLPLSHDALDELATELKRQCGSGGTVKDGQIEIQGDHRNRLISELTNKGYKCKRAGG